MGVCFSGGGSAAASSSFADDQKSSCANVISVNGDLRQYSIPVTAAQVVESETTSTSSSFFLCNSDHLYFDDYIPALAPHHLLEPSQIYFLLPLPKLHYKLTASDMAALAVKASLALQAHNNSIPTTSRNNNKKARVSPVLLLQDDGEDQPPPSLLHQPYQSNLKINHTTAYKNKHELQRSSSSRKLQRLLSSRRRSKLAAVPSFRIRLTTISEGSVLLFN